MNSRVEITKGQCTRNGYKEYTREISLSLAVKARSVPECEALIVPDFLSRVPELIRAFL